MTARPIFLLDLTSNYPCTDAFELIMAGRVRHRQTLDGWRSAGPWLGARGGSPLRLLGLHNDVREGKRML